MKPAVFSFLSLAIIAADPPTFEFRKTAVRTLLEHGEFVAALQDAHAINREWPDDVPTYQLVAKAHLGLGNYAEAEKAIQWMLDLRIGKADAQGWLLVASIREITGDFEGALDAVQAGYASLPPGPGPDRLSLLSR